MDEPSEVLFRNNIISAITVEAEMTKLLQEASKLSTFLTEMNISPKNSLRMKFFNDAIFDLKNIIKQHPNWVIFCMESRSSDKQKLTIRLKKILYRFESFSHFIASQKRTRFPLILKAATRKLSALIAILTFKNPPKNRIGMMIERVFEDYEFGFPNSYAMRFRSSSGICMAEVICNVERSDDEVKICRRYDFVGENCNPEKICRKMIGSNLYFELSSSLLEGYVLHSLYKTQFIFFLHGFNENTFMGFLSLVRILPLAAKGSKFVLINHVREASKLFGELIPIFQNFVISGDMKQVKDKIRYLMIIKNPFGNLGEITLYRCMKCEVFYVRQLPHLKGLNIKRCRSLTALSRNEEEGSRGRLVKLSVNECANMESISLSLLAYLETLSLINCPKLRRVVFSGVSMRAQSRLYTSVRHFIIKNCPILPTIAYGGKDVDGESSIAQKGGERKVAPKESFKVDTEEYSGITNDTTLDDAEIAVRPASPRLPTNQEIDQFCGDFISAGEDEWLDFHGFRVTPRHHPYLEKVYKQENDFWSSCIHRGRASIALHLNILGEALARLDTTWKSLNPSDLTFVINAVEDSLAAGFRVQCLQQHSEKARRALNRKKSAKREDILLELSSMVDGIKGLTKELASLGFQNLREEAFPLPD